MATGGDAQLANREAALLLGAGHPVMPGGEVGVQEVAVDELRDWQWFLATIRYQNTIDVLGAIHVEQARGGRDQPTTHVIFDSQVQAGDAF